MRLPLRVRVVVLVTAFNLAVFGGGLYWVSSRLDRERRARTGIDRELVIERLQGLLARGGPGVVADVLDWPYWSRYEDAQVVQLRDPDAARRSGLSRDLDRVAATGRIEHVPRGVVLPLYPAPRRGPTLLRFPPAEWGGRWLVPYPGPVGPWIPPLLVPAFADAVTTWIAIPQLEPRRRGPVRGAVFHPRRFTWPWELPRHLVLVGLSPIRQPRYDAILARSSQYLRRAMETAWREARTIEIEGGTLVPLHDRDGARWGAAFLPFRELQPADLWPWNWTGEGFRGWIWPWNLFRNASIHGLPEFGFGPAPIERAGLYLNPLGAADRDARFDQAAVLTELKGAAREGERRETPRGLAVPLRMESGELWGGVWLRPRSVPGVPALLRELLPWFLATTVLLTLATFIGMRTLVLEPVRRLARGARRLALGDLTARVPESPRRDELADLVRAFNTMAAQVEGFNATLAHEVERATEQARAAEVAAMTQRRLAATGELAAGIAHEINNPLGGMLNALEVLGRDDLPPERRRAYLDLLRGGLERIQGTVGGVLRLAPRETRTEPIDLAEPLGDALGLVRHRARTLGVRLVLEGAGGPRELGEAGALEPWRGLPRVRGQANELGQAVLNLLVNALDSVEEAGGQEVRVGLDRAGENLHLWILDDGVGMDPELLPRAADLFFTTKDAGRGTGLGLAIAHNVIGGHGGTVRLANRPGGGFRVDIELPRGGEATP